MAFIERIGLVGMPVRTTARSRAYIELNNVQYIF
jgi:hypothetical protein